MKRWLWLLSVLALSGLGASRQGGVPAWASRVLPAQASLTAYAPLPGLRNTYALVYRTTGSYVAIARTSYDHDRLLWRHRLLGATPSLSAPGPVGLFQGKDPDASSQTVRFYAYVLHHGVVSSAIAHARSGEVSADEEVKVRTAGFTLWNRDVKHVGSVQYRLRTRYQWTPAVESYVAISTTRAPDYPAGTEPTPNGTVHTHTGDVILLRLEIANTEQLREVGLMNRKSLDPDSGMVFVWQQPVQDSFWMQHTYIPLTIAFLDADGRILEMQDMEPLTTTLHTPAQPYLYALEANQGFFAAHGIRVGDQIHLHLSVPTPLPQSRVWTIHTLIAV